MQQNEQHWKKHYIKECGVGNIMVLGEGAHLVECASKAVEDIMHSEDHYLCHFWAA